jgi:hypothetical protein
MQISNQRVALESDEFNSIIGLNHLIYKMRMSSHVGPLLQEAFRKGRRSLQWRLGDKLVKHHISYFFLCARQVPMHIVLIESNLSLALYYLCMCYLCTTYRVLYDDVICCMIVNFHIYLLL